MRLILTKGSLTHDGVQHISITSSRSRFCNMSTVSFPGGASHTHSHSTSTQEDFFGSSYNPSSSFQVNPLSHHPPRTPRTSVISAASQSYVYGSEIYGSSTSQQEETQEKPAAAAEYEEEEVAEDVEDTVSQETAKKVKTPEVWREMLKTSSGRDKAFVSAFCEVN